MTRPSANQSGGKFLFIAYHFPPSAAIGGRRIVNFAVELRSLGWQPQVLTIADKDIEHVDRTRLNDVQGIPIHKAGVGPSLIGAAEWLWVRIRPRKRTPASNAMHSGSSLNRLDSQLDRACEGSFSPARIT